ncbi:MAG: response regulator [Cuspidothrix sp.]
MSSCQELSQGSTFSLELDLLTLKQANVAENIIKFNENLSDYLPLKILIVEDNKVNQKIADKLFQKLGYPVIIVNNGVEALNVLKQEMYDVVFMDIQMPELDGIETTKAIYQEWGETNRPYIIAMTANAMPSDREQCLSVGMDDYISKPIKIEAIVASIQLLRQRRFDSK